MRPISRGRLLLCVAHHKTKSVFSEKRLRIAQTRLEPSGTNAPKRTLEATVTPFFGPRSAGRRSCKTNRCSSVVVAPAERFHQTSFSSCASRDSLLSTRGRVAGGRSIHACEYHSLLRSLQEQESAKSNVNLLFFQSPDAPSSVESLKSRVLSKKDSANLQQERRDQRFYPFEARSFPSKVDGRGAFLLQRS